MGLPTPLQIVRANRALLARHPEAPSAKHAHRTCWACSGRGPVERAHVIARSFGGSNEPENFFLLCHRCHRDQPDGAPRYLQEQWLFNHESQVDVFMRVYVRPMMAALTNEATYYTPGALNRWFATEPFRSGFVGFATEQSKHGALNIDTCTSNVITEVVRQFGLYAVENEDFR